MVRDAGKSCSIQFMQRNMDDLTGHGADCACRNIVGDN